MERQVIADKTIAQKLKEDTIGSQNLLSFRTPNESDDLCTHLEGLPSNDVNTVISNDEDDNTCSIQNR